MILIAIAVIEAIIIAYLIMLHTGKIKDADGDFIADSVEAKVEEIQVNAVNKLNRLKAELGEFDIRAEIFNTRTFEYSKKTNIGLKALSKLVKIPKIRVLIYRIFRNRIILSLSNKFDSIDIHFYSPIYNSIIEKIDKPIKVVFWGSDLYRVEDERIDEIKKSLGKIKTLHFLTPEMKNFAEEKGITHSNSFVQPFGVVHFDVIKTLKETYDPDKAKLPKDKAIMAVGYNASPNQQHIKIINEINLLPKEVKDKIHFIFLLTYGGNKDYILSIKDLLIKNNLDFTIIEKRLSEIELCKIRLSVDITMNFQITDGFSSSIQEHFYAENIMILGEWLPYNWLKTYGLNFHNVRLQNLSKTILDILSNLDSEKELAKKNAKNIEVISKWSSCISKWKDIYEATEENK